MRYGKKLKPSTKTKRKPRSTIFSKNSDMPMNEIGPRATPEQTEALPHPNAEATHEELQVSVLSNAARAAEARLQQLITTNPNLEEGEKGKLWERIKKMVQKEVDRNMEAIQQFETQDPTVFR